MVAHLLLVKYKFIFENPFHGVIFLWTIYSFPTCFPFMAFRTSFPFMDYFVNAYPHLKNAKTENMKKFLLFKIDLNETSYVPVN